MPYADIEKKKARQKAHYKANKEKISAQRKDYRENNKETLLARYKVNKEKVLARNKVYRDNNKEKISTQVKVYIKENPQIIIKCILARAMQIPANLIPPELIEAKVMQLKVMRFLRDAKKKTPLIKAGSG